MVTAEVKERANVFNNRFYPEVDRRKILSVRLSGMFLWLAVISYTLVVYDIVDVLISPCSYLSVIFKLS